METPGNDSLIGMIFKETGIMVITQTVVTDFISGPSQVNSMTLSKAFTLFEHDFHHVQ